MAENNSGEIAGGEQQQQQKTEQAPKTCMFYIDQVSQQWLLDPYYESKLTNQFNLNNYLIENPNPDISEQEYALYVHFLQSLNALITKVFNREMYYQQEYDAWINFTAQQNPKGYELKEKQRRYFEHLQKKEEKKEAKEKNKGKEQKQQQEDKKVVAPPEQKIVNRPNDPEIYIPKLFTTKWDEEKYINSELLTKENANIVFIGHVDSGKSTLTGNIIKELKEIDEQELARNKQELKQNKMEAWENAGVADVIPEQRVDGKTREYAKLNFSLTKKRFTLFDAPGHRNYVPNMIMGACQADVAVLIISAKEGEFQSGFEKDGQTKDHAMLAKALGVIELIAVVTKMGTVNWSQQRFNHIRDQVNPYLENNCGFHNVTFIPLDSILNQNIHSKHQVGWYKGPVFLDYLDNVPLPKRNPEPPLRIPVIDKFKDMGQLFVYGKIESGTIVEDHPVTILPQRIYMTIKQIFNAKDQRMPFALAGENVKMRVKNIEEHDISRGDMICNNLNYCQESAELKANVTVLELPQEKKLLSSGYECILHMHAIAAQVEISKVQKIDKESQKLTKIAFLIAGDKGVCHIKIERPLCLQKFEFMPSLGRFTLRDENKTIGYGEIIGLKPAKKLYDEQKEHLMGDKKEETKTVGSANEDLVKKVEQVTIENKQ